MDADLDAARAPGNRTLFVPQAYAEQHMLQRAHTLSTSLRARGHVPPAKTLYRVLDAYCAARHFEGMRDILNQMWARGIRQPSPPCVALVGVYAQSGNAAGLERLGLFATKRKRFGKKKYTPTELHVRLIMAYGAWTPAAAGVCPPLPAPPPRLS